MNIKQLTKAILTLTLVLTAVSCVISAVELYHTRIRRVYFSAN